LVMASFQFSPMILLSHEPITELAQLSGKSVMHFGNLQIKALIEKGAGVVVQPIQEIPSSGDLQDFIDHKVDFYAAYSTNEPYRLNQFKKPFFILDPKSYGIQSYGDLIFTHQQKYELLPSDVASFREATIAGWEYAIRHQTEVVDFILHNFEVKKSRNALLSEAQAITKYVKSGKQVIGEVEPRKLLATAVYAQESGLINDVELKNIDIKRFVYDASHTLYSAEELSYLREHPVIRIGNHIDWAPFEYIDKTGEYKGLAAAYFDLMGDKLEVAFEPVRDKSSRQVLEMSQAGLLDVLSCTVETIHNSNHLNFTKPYLSFPIVLAASKTVDYIDDYDQLNGQTIAVTTNSWPHESFAQFYPDVNLLLVDSVMEGLLAVLKGRAIGYSGNLAAINYVMKQQGLDGLHIIGQSSRRFELAVGVHKNNPVLYSILQKTLATITPAERQQIYNDWIQLRVVTESARWLYLVALILLVLLVLLLVWILAVQHSKKILQSYIDTINELSLATVTDNKGIVIWVSDSFAKLSGYDKQELLGQPASKTKSITMSDEEYRKIYQRVSMGETWRGEVEGRRKDGSLYYVNLTAIPEMRFGKLQKVTITREDLTDRKKAEELSIRDALTGLYNRRYFSEVFEREIRRAQRERLPFVFAMADIDFFKNLNDNYGHQYGDIALQKVSNVLQQSLRRPQDLVFRLGGEEFGMILNEIDLEHVSYFLNNLAATIKALKIQNKAGVDGVVTISVGAIILSPDHHLSSEAVFKLADDLMYQAKEAGRDQVVVEAIQ
ncbi:MAG: diguanylate cyclase, partial [Pseudomonadota bacterium]